MLSTIQSSSSHSSSTTSVATNLDYHLSLEQEQKLLNEFVQIVNGLRSRQSQNGVQSPPISSSNARKFLCARKFDLKRALLLYKAHEMIRLREGLMRFDLNSQALRNEMFSGKFTVLPTRDPASGCCITLFSACKHNPLHCTHQVTLQNIVLQLDVCISNEDAQNNGILFIYNMNNSKYANFDYELSQKILALLKGAYPAKLKKVLIITPPIWFKAPFKILRLFVREKLRDRVHMLSQSQLRKHLPMSCLPIELGGQLKLEHEKWIDHCLKQLKENAIESGAGGSSSFISITDSASSQRSSTGSSMAFGTASSTSRSNSLPVAPIDSQFVFNCELIGQSLCSFNTDSSDLTDSIHKRTGRNGHDDDDDDEDDEEDFHKVHSELDLSGLSEQLTGLCDKLATNFEADLGIPSNSISDSCTTTGSSGDAATSLCTVESGNDAIATKTYTNGTPTNGNTNGSINGNTNGTSLPKHHHHHTIVSEQNSIDSTGTGGCTRIGKHKPDNIPIRLEQVRVESINGQNGQLTCSSNKNGSSDTIGCPSTVTESELEQLLDLQIQFLNDNPISLHLSSDPGMGLNEFIQYLNGKGRRGLYDEYDSLRKRKNFAFIFDNWTRFREFGLQKKTEMIGSLGAEIDSLLDESIYNSDGEASLEALLEPAKVSYAVNANHLPMLDLFTYKNSLKKENVAKNRYSDVLCYDHSRVRLDLSGRESPEPFDGFDLVQTDYINANFVDGFEQKNAFISTQGPLNSTCVDFWEMCISNDVKVIVMTTRTMERQRIKCSQYWPLQPLSQLNFGHLTLINDGVEQFQDYVITKLTLRNNKNELSYQITHMQFVSWPDYGVPTTACAMLEFRQRVRDELQQSMNASDWPLERPAPPIVVHCSAGIGRTGTFITLDISILRLQKTGRVCIQNTVEKIRSQRAHSIQTQDQYVFCYLALLEYALINNMLGNVDLSGFEDSDSELED